MGGGELRSRRSVLKSDGDENREGPIGRKCRKVENLAKSLFLEGWQRAQAKVIKCEKSGFVPTFGRNGVKVGGEGMRSGRSVLKSARHFDGDSVIGRKGPESGKPGGITVLLSLEKS